MPGLIKPHRSQLSPDTVTVEEFGRVVASARVLSWAVAGRSLYTTRLVRSRWLPCQYPQQSRVTMVRAHLPIMSRKMLPFLQYRLPSWSAISLA